MRMTTTTQTKLATLEDDEREPNWAGGSTLHHLGEGDHAHEPYLYGKIHVAGRTFLVNVLTR